MNRISLTRVSLSIAAFSCTTVLSGCAADPQPVSTTTTQGINAVHQTREAMKEDAKILTQGAKDRVAAEKGAAKQGVDQIKAEGEAIKKDVQEIKQILQDTGK